MSVQNFQPTLEIGEAIIPIVQTLGAAETDVIVALKPGWHYYIDGVVISNITAVARTFTLYLKADGVAGAAGNSICAGVTLAANTIYQLPIGPLTIPAGYELTGLASAASAINVTVTGRVIVEPPIEVQL
jgi:alpha-tubulin suppressor-like RCC1 family protein